MRTCAEAEQRQNFAVFFMVNIAHVYKSQSRRFWWALFVACATGLLLSPAAWAATFNATLDRNNVAVGESLTLTLSFEGGAAPQPALPGIPGLQVTGTSSSQSFKMINGVTSAQVNYQYTLIATQEGEITIPAMTLKIDGQTLTSQPIKLTVTKAPVVSATQAEGTPSDAFAKLILPKNEVYFGETVPAEVRLYFQNVRDVHMPEISADGFTMTPINQRPEQTQAQMNGITYNLAIFKFTLSPAKTGTLKVGPAKVSMAIMTEPRRDFFGQTVFARVRPALIVSEEATLRVLPLPTQNKPASFSGAIGRFTMQMSASPASLAVGDPITVRVRISGRGALESLRLPEQPAWRDFKSYPPSSKVESTDPLGLEGTKNFELVISPQNAAIKVLPPFEFSYFDSALKTYKTLSSQAVPLQVRSSALTPQPTRSSGNGADPDPPSESSEIIHIKPQIGTIVDRSEKPLFARPGFWIAQGIPPALWLVALLYRRRKESLNNNPRLRLQKAVEQSTQRNLQKLRDYAAANKSDEFFATVFHLLQEQIGERLDLPPTAITEAVVDTDLRKRGLNAEGVDLLHGLFQTCNQARYAPVRGSHELASYIPKVERAVVELKKLNDEPVTATV